MSMNKTASFGVDEKLVQKLSLSLPRLLKKFSEHFELRTNNVNSTASCNPWAFWTFGNKISCTCRKTLYGNSFGLNFTLMQLRLQHKNFKMIRRGQISCYKLSVFREDKNLCINEGFCDKTFLIAKFSTHCSNSLQTFKCLEVFKTFKPPFFLENWREKFDRGNYFAFRLQFALFNLKFISTWTLIVDTNKSLLGRLDEKFYLEFWEKSFLLSRAPRNSSLCAWQWVVNCKLWYIEDAEREKSCF